MTASGRRPSLLALAVVALTAPAACNGPRMEQDQEVADAVHHGRYAEALEDARRLAEANPKDPIAAALYRDAQVAYILDQGRSEVFRGDLTRALDRLHEAQRIAPDHPAVVKWIGKIRAQLAVMWLDIAADCTGPDRLDDAEIAFEKVLTYDPGNLDAVRGLSHVLLLKNYRAGMSKSYFDEGLTSFRELLLEQARRSFQVSNLYRENDPATVRGEQVELMRAEERLAQAKSLEASGLYFAARNEYRLVLLIDPTNAAGKSGLDRMDREVRAARSLAEAEMEIRRGELEDAEKTLAQAEILTEAQADYVSLMQSGIEDRRLEDMYQTAQTLTKDYRYPEAVLAYEALLAVAPDYKDALLRKKTIEEFISLAEEFYAKALAATDDAEAEGYLRRIHPVLWPEYKDVAQRLAVIEARKPAPPDPEPAAEENGGSGDDDPDADEGD